MLRRAARRANGRAQLCTGSRLVARLLGDEGLVAVVRAVGTTQGLLRSAETEIGMPRITDWPAALIRLEAGYGFGYVGIAAHREFALGEMATQSSGMRLDLCDAPCTLMLRSRAWLRLAECAMIGCRDGLLCGNKWRTNKGLGPPCETGAKTPFTKSASCGARAPPFPKGLASNLSHQTAPQVGGGGRDHARVRSAHYQRAHSDSKCETKERL
jgi:hypothetical protein